MCTSLPAAFIEASYNNGGTSYAKIKTLQGFKVRVTELSRKPGLIEIRVSAALASKLGIVSGGFIRVSDEQRS